MYTCKNNVSEFDGKVRQTYRPFEIECNLASGSHREVIFGRKPHSLATERRAQRSHLCRSTRARRESSDRQKTVYREVQRYAYHPALYSECLNAELVVLLVAHVERCVVYKVRAGRYPRIEGQEEGGSDRLS